MELYYLLKLGNFEGNPKQLLFDYLGNPATLLKRQGVIQHLYVKKINEDIVTVIVDQKFLVFSKNEPSFSLAIIGKSKEQNQEIMQTLESILGLTLEPAPEELKGTEVAPGVTVQ